MKFNLDPVPFKPCVAAGTGQSGQLGRVLFISPQFRQCQSISWGGGGLLIV